MKYTGHKLALFVSVIGILFLLVGSSYAIFSGTISSEKKQIVQAGKVKIVLIEPTAGLDLGLVQAMADVDGLIQSNYYTFGINNIGDAKASYKLYLLDDSDKLLTYVGNLVDDNYIHVGLKKDGVEVGPLNLKTVNRLIDSGTLDKGASHTYQLRLWLNFGDLSDAEIENMYGSSKFLKLKVTAEQVVE